MGCEQWTRHQTPPHSAMGSTMDHYGPHYGGRSNECPSRCTGWGGALSERGARVYRLLGSSWRAGRRNGARLPETRECRAPEPREGKQDCHTHEVRSSEVRSSLVRPSERDATEREPLSEVPLSAKPLSTVPARCRRARCRPLRLGLKPAERGEPGECRRAPGLRAGGAPQCERPGAQHAC